VRDLSPQPPDLDPARDWRGRLRSPAAPGYDARVKKTRSDISAAPVTVPRWTVHAFGLVLLATQIVYLAGTAGPFRTPKQSLVTAGMLTVVCLALAIGLARGAVRIGRGPLALVLISLPLIQAASLLWSFDRYLALQSAGHSAVWALAVLWMAALPAQDRRRTLHWCAAGVGVSALVLVLQVLGIPVLELARASGRFSLTGLSGNPADASTACVLLLPLLLVSVKEHREGRWRWPLIVLLAMIPMISRTLTGVVAVVALAGVWILLHRSVRTLAVTSAAVVVVLAVGLATGLGDRVERAVRQADRADWYALLSARPDGWTAALEMTRSHPVAGAGAGNYTNRFYPSRLAWLDARNQVGRRGEMATHFEWAHCDPLQHLAELGIIGGLWLVALAGALWRAARCAPELSMLAAAAAAPFLALQYPAHLAVGMVPLALILAELVATEEPTDLRPARPLARGAAALALLGIAIAGCVWQLRAMAVDVWQAELDLRINAAQVAPDAAQRDQIARATERSVLSRIDSLPSAAPWLWRVVGKARLLQGQATTAETAFRNAGALWLHEEVDFGLGLALAAQGRRGEALIHLGRVCRLNPRLAEQIQEPELRRAVTELTEARRNR
jgi:O-antigen ligase